MKDSPPNDDEFDVVIVGGGPIGAALAGDLGRRGVRTLIIEQGDGLVTDSRLHLVNIRSMEILRSYGLEQEMRDCGWPAEHTQDVSFVTRLDGREIARIAWPAIADMVPPEHSPTFAQRCPQAWFNPIMLDFAARQPATTLRFNTRMDSFTETSDGVSVTLVDSVSGAQSTIRAKYLVGCDGSHSSVRRQLPVVRERVASYGQSVAVIFRAPELASIMKMGVTGRFIMLSEKGLSASLVPFDGRDTYRLMLMVQPSEMDEEQMREEIRALADEPFDFEFVTPLLPWINRQVSASSYAVGRVVLAGDSAHGMPPTGGFGMNSGLVDAYDLGWRLAALVEGWGGPALLESYDIERRAGIARISGLASDIYQDWLDWNPKLREMARELDADGPDADALRMQIGHELVETFGREFNPQGAVLGYRYNDSPICISDGSPDPEDLFVDYVQTARPGHRAPHMWLEDGRSTLDLFGHGYTLLDLTGQADRGSWEAAFAKYGIPFKVVILTSEEALRIFGAGHVLVRPDGMVSWRSHATPGDLEEIARRVSGMRESVAA